MGQTPPKPPGVQAQTHSPGQGQTPRSLTSDSSTNSLSKRIKNGIEQGNNKGFSTGWYGLLTKMDTTVSESTGQGTNL